MKFSRESFEKTLAQFIKETKTKEKSNSTLSNFNKKRISFLNLYFQNILITLPRQPRRYVMIILFLMSPYFEIIRDSETEKWILTGSGTHSHCPNMPFLIMIKHGLRE